MDWQSFFLIVLPGLITVAAFFVLQVVESRSARMMPVQKDGRQFTRPSISQRLFFYGLALCMLVLLTLITAAWAFGWGTPDVETWIVVALAVFVFFVSFSLLWIGTRWYAWDDESILSGTDVTMRRRFLWINLTSVRHEKLNQSYALNFGPDGTLRVKQTNVAGAIILLNAKKLLADSAPR